jgi:hypothetical protein
MSNWDTQVVLRRRGKRWRVGVGEREEEEGVWDSGKRIGYNT